MIQVVSYFRNCLQEQQTIIDNLQSSVANYQNMLDDVNKTVISLVMKEMLN